MIDEGLKCGDIDMDFQNIWVRRSLIRRYSIQTGDCPDTPIYPSIMILGEN